MPPLPEVPGSSGEKDWGLTWQSFCCPPRRGKPEICMPSVSRTIVASEKEKGASYVLIREQPPGTFPARQSRKASLRR